MLSSAKRIIKRVYNRCYMATAMLFHPDRIAQKFYSAGYDNAKTTVENKEHWGNATDQSPPVANDRETRRKLRVRARYETDNNSYCSGTVSTLSTDVIGYIGPKLRILSATPGLKALIEAEWKKWNEHHTVNLTSKLKLLDETKRVEGEGFLSMHTDDEVGEATGVAIGINVIGAGRVTDPFDWTNGLIYEYEKDEFGNEVYDENGQMIVKRKLFNDDGVVVDLKTGRPIRFHVTSIEDELQGSNQFRGSGEPISARYMLQWFNPRRPGQFRGISELTPSIGLFGQLRRYGLATLTAAEFAAAFAGVMSTNAPPQDGPVAVNAWQQFPIERGMLLSLPEGWAATQFDPRHPMQSQEMFVNLILREIGRSLNVPFGIIAGDSSRYNYSSAQLDYRGYEEQLKYDKQQLNIRIMNPLFMEWLRELAKIYPQVDLALSKGDIYFSWTYAVRPSSDPSKDAQAEEIRLRNQTITYDEIYAARGGDWEESFEQISKEQAKKKFLGISGNSLDNSEESATIQDEGNTALEESNEETTV